jgi:anti-anti-sigma regulatory factor
VITTTVSKADAQVVTVEGGVDPGAVVPLWRRIAEATDGGHRRVILDLGAATLIDTATVGLSGALSRLNRAGTALAIVGIPSHMRRVLDVFDVRGVEHYPDLDSALSAVRADQAFAQ